MAEDKASVSLALERLQAIVQAHSVRATPDAQSLQVDLLETLEDLRRDAGLQTAAEISLGKQPEESERAGRQQPPQHPAPDAVKTDVEADIQNGDGNDTANQDDAALPPTPPPVRLARSTSDCNGGVLPNVWLEDLQPHFEMLQQHDEQQEQLAASEETPAPAQTQTSNTFPDDMQISLREAHHLVLVVHGIGKHHDFKDASMSWDGSYGELSGGFYDFKSKFYEILGPSGALKNLPMMINFESIEWHEPLRESCNVEEVLKEAAPEGIASLREFVTEAMTDGLLYWSQRYGQSIIDSVAWQLNEKFKSFKETHPGFTGPVSIFAHSLGSIIIFDLLSRCRKDIRTPRLDFDVNVFFLAGSPLAYMHLCRGDLFDDGGTYIPSYFLPESVRVVNLFHINDPVAWRLGPLLVEKKLNQDKKAKAENESGTDAKEDLEGEEKRKQIREQVEATGVTVTLPHASEVDSLSLEEILLKFAELFHFTPDDATRSSKLHLRPIDFGLPTSRYERVVELASATSAHSSYWGNTSLALGVIMTLCESLMPILLLYKQRGIRASVTPRRMQLSLSHPALAIEPVMEEGPVKGFWAQRFCVLQDDGLFLFDKDVQEAAGAKLTSIPLDRCQIRVKVLAKDKGSGRDAKASTTPTNASSSTSSFWSSSSSSSSSSSIASQQDATNKDGQMPPREDTGTPSTMQCPSEAFMLVVRDPSAKGTVTYDISAKSQTIAQWWVDGIQQAQQAYLYSQGNLEQAQQEQAQQEQHRPRRHSMSNIRTSASSPGRSRMGSIASAPDSAHCDASNASNASDRPLHEDSDGDDMSPKDESRDDFADETNGTLTDGTLDEDTAEDEDEGNEDNEEDDEDEPPSDLFDLVRYGNLVVNVSTQWTGKSTKWFALRRGADSINYFEREPKLQPIRQIDLTAVHLVQGSRMQRLLRLVYTGGGAINIRFTRDGVYERWHRLVSQHCVHARFEDLSIKKRSFHLPRSPLSDDDLAASEDVELSVAVTGYVICREPGTTSSFASYTINVMVAKSDEGAHVVRRYSDFKTFAKDLAKELDVKLGPNDVPVLPALPSSTLLPTLQPSYLNRQVQKLHGYLSSLSKIKEVQGCSAWYAFLLRSDESPSRSRQRSSSGMLPRRSVTSVRNKAIDPSQQTGDDEKQDEDTQS
ncbi:Phospholipase DDHD1 [Hondaea fermentalgiana]|uniref:Phospholipase DDHD1 n=1 Tax=Hondaea fermentalgiana TaxID=2315210 RepID=A0A2R5GRZ4_9STRA|nr:Phospholipase DDHD1 [Hondaea fermentalgiana]|eukprot:GBG33656.1 Phospholipase DDHD1 [Hondaea fermentalgiana]